MGNTEAVIKLILGVIYVAGTCVSGMVLAAFQAHLNTRAAEKKIHEQRENHQNDRLRAIESALNERGIVSSHHRKN